MKRNRKKISQKLFTPLTSPHPLGSSARISTKGYSESYREICSKIHIMPNNHITSDLRNCEMKLNIDELKEKDLKSIQASLPGFQLLKKIFIWGRNFTDLVLQHDFYSSGSIIPSASEPFLRVKSPRKFYLVPNPEDKSDSEIHIDPGTVCNSRNRSYNAKVLKSLSLNMANNRAMTDIKLIGLKIGKEGWNFLAEGLGGEIPLINLYINFCKMEDENLSVLIPPLMKSKTIKNLDFSSNELEESCGYDIGRIINMQIERRDHDMWLAGLRGSYIENPNKEGLEELNLSNNKLKDKAIYDLCHAFYHDNVLRCLDFKKNKITLDGIKEIVSLLYSNSTLLFLDIRENVNNEGTGILKAIISKLRKNFAEYSHENVENKSWKAKLMKLQQSIDPIFISEPNSFKDEKQPKKMKLRRKDTFDSDEYKNDELANKYLMKSHSEEISKNSSESESESEEYIRPRQSLGNEHYLLQGHKEKIHDKCLQCIEYEEALENAESVCRALNIENTNLKKQIETLRKNDRNQQSWSNSAISRVEGQAAYIPQPESISAINASKQVQGGTGDDRGALQRIEAMMSELTRLMDVLETSNRAGNAQSSML